MLLKARGDAARTLLLRQGGGGGGLKGGYREGSVQALQRNQFDLQVLGCKLLVRTFKAMEHYELLAPMFRCPGLPGFP